MSRDFKSVFIELIESGETFELNEPIVLTTLDEDLNDPIEISDEIEKEIDVSISAWYFKIYSVE